MSKKDVDPKNLLPLAKYLLILVESYPQPIRANVLAEKTGHSKAAISKIRERLMQVCDPDPMVFEKGFVLSQNFNLIPSIFIALLAHGSHKRFLTSRFFRTFVSSRKVHDKIVTIFPPYGERFTSDETGFLIQKIVGVIERLSPSDFKLLLELLTSRKPSTVTELAALQDVTKNLKKIEFTFRNKEEFVKTIILRDKFFFLIRDVLWAKIEEMKILTKLDKKNKVMYKNVYKTTIDHYLRDIFSILNESLMSAGGNFVKNTSGLTPIGSSHFPEDGK